MTQIIIKLVAMKKVSVLLDLERLHIVFPTVNKFQLIISPGEEKMFELDNETSWTDNFEVDLMFDTKNSSANITELNLSPDHLFNAKNSITEINIPYVVMEVIVAIFAVIGNLTVIVAFFRERKLRKRTNFYIISLALADLCGKTETLLSEKFSR